MPRHPLFRVLVAFALALGIVPVATASAAGTSLDFVVLNACTDSVFVTVAGSAVNATNRVMVEIYAKDDEGHWTLRSSALTANFGSGPYTQDMEVILRPGAGVAPGAEMRVEATLTMLVGNGGFVRNSSTQTRLVNAVVCQTRCRLTIGAADAAPTNGTLQIRGGFGTWFRPEGRLEMSLAVTKGQRVFATAGGVDCNMQMRAWWYPAGGTTPLLLPNAGGGEFGTGGPGSHSFFGASFAAGRPATDPLEQGDLFFKPSG